MQTLLETPRRRWLTSKFLVVSLLVHLLLGVGATAWMVRGSAEPRKQMFQRVPARGPAAPSAMEYKVQLKRRAALSAPGAMKRVTATVSQAKFTLPAMPPTPGAAVGLGAAGRLAGMSGPGMSGPGPVSRAGLAPAAGGAFMASIGGLNVQARRLAVALDVSGSVAQYEEGLKAYIARTFQGSEVGTFTTAGFVARLNRHGSIRSVVMDFLRSPKGFDSIYIFSDFGETRGDQSGLAEVQELVRSKKVRIYLHILRDPGLESKLSPALQNVIAFAKGTGGNVKIGGMPRM